MASITVTALQDQMVGDRLVSIGDQFEVSPVEAVMLRRKGVAALTSDTYKTNRALKAKAKREEVAEPRRRRYRRRDLTAE